MKAPRLLTGVVLFTLCGAMVAGCAGQANSPATSSAADHPVSGDIPDNTVYVAVTAPSGAFSVKVPQGWAQTAGAAATTIYTDKLNSISFQQMAAATAPDTSAVRVGLVPQLRSSQSGFALKDVSAVSLPAGTAIRVRYTADAAANAVTGKATTDAVEAYVFWRKGTEAVLTLSGPESADNVDPWKTVSESFAWAS